VEVCGPGCRHRAPIAVKLIWRRSEKRDRDMHTLIEHADTADLEDYLAAAVLTGTRLCKIRDAAGRL
jgi:hypothetical protein